MYKTLLKNYATLLRDIKYFSVTVYYWYRTNHQNWRSQTTTILFFPFSMDQEFIKRKKGLSLLHDIQTLSQEDLKSGSDSTVENWNHLSICLLTCLVPELKELSYNSAQNLTLKLELLMGGHACVWFPHILDFPAAWQPRKRMSYSSSSTGSLNLIKLSVFSILTYGFNAIPIKITIRYVCVCVCNSIS